MVFNKPYDESVEASDAEEVTSTQDSPGDQPTQQVSSVQLCSTGRYL